MGVNFANYVYLTNTCFQNNQSITAVDCRNVYWVDNSMLNAFANCTSLTTINNISNTVEAMPYTFYNCPNFTTAPTIPNSVTNLHYTFYNCQNLQTAPIIPPNTTTLNSTFSSCTKLTTAPTIPNSVVHMRGTFASCRNLTSIPTIPDSVEDLWYTFAGCSNITAAETISHNATNISQMFLICPNLATANINSTYVNDMFMTFKGCTSLTGNIYIKSYDITNATDCFNGTSLQKNVYIPFKYINNVATKTYNAFTNAGYTTNGAVDGVYLKSLVKWTINPIPVDATVNLTSTGYTQEGNSLYVPAGASVHIEVSKAGYNTFDVYGYSDVDINETVTLEPIHNGSVNVTGFEYKINNNVATLTKYVGSDTDIVVPVVNA